MKKVFTFLSIGVLLIAVSCQKQTDKPAELPESSQKKEFSLEFLEATRAKTKESIATKISALDKLSAQLLAESKAMTGISGKAPGKPIIMVPGDYTTIQDAVNNASDGAVINVSGSYTENVMISDRSNITINGGGSATLTISSEHVYTFAIVNSSNIIIKGFTILNGPVTVLASSQIEISNNDVSGIGDGIQLLESSNCVIKNNSVHDNSYHPVPAAGLGTGLVLRRSNYNTITNNYTNSNAEGGILLFGSSENTLKSNISANNQVRGIGLFPDTDIEFTPVVQGSNSNTLQMNDVSGAPIAIFILGESSDNIIKGNQLHNNPYGLILEGDNGIVSRTRISDCIFDNNGIINLILWSGTSDNLMTGITANNSNLGIVFYTGSSNNTIRNSTATGNYNCDYWDMGTNNTSVNNTFGHTCD